MNQSCIIKEVKVKAFFVCFKNKLYKFSHFFKIKKRNWFSYFLSIHNYLHYHWLFENIFLMIWAKVKEWIQWKPCKAEQELVLLVLKGGHLIVIHMNNHLKFINDRCNSFEKSFEIYQYWFIIIFVLCKCTQGWTPGGCNKYSCDDSFEISFEIDQ